MGLRVHQAVADALLREACEPVACVARGAPLGRHAAAREAGELGARQNVLERRYAVRLLDFLGNISTVLSLRLQHLSRRLIGERLADVIVPPRRLIVLIEAKWCAVDLPTVALTWLLVGMYVWPVQREPDAGQLLLGGVFMVHQYAGQAGGVIGAMAANLRNFSRFKPDYATAEPIWNAAEPTFDRRAAEAGNWKRPCTRSGSNSRTFAPTGGAAASTKSMSRCIAAIASR